MPTNLVESTSYDANVQVPVDGDPRNAASVQVGFQALANRTKKLKAMCDGVAGISTTGIEIYVPLTTAMGMTGSGSWVRYTTPATAEEWDAWLQDDVTAAKGMRFRVPMPAGGTFTVTGFRAHVSGSNGAITHSNVPATRPSARLTSMAKVGPPGGGTTHVTVQNTYGNAAAYNANHDITTITAGGLNFPVDHTRRYYVEFLGEAGANSVANALILSGVYITLLGS